ncbi:MAG: type I 3-dehydroquinate dehydratase [Lactovum sp.]
MTSIIVPFCPSDLSEVESIDLTWFVGADMIEWRADFLPVDKIFEAAEIIFKKFRDWPILFTLRSQAEGGRFTQSELIYNYILKRILKEYRPNFVDVEAYSRKKSLKEFSNYLDKLVYSYHNLSEIPEDLVTIMSDFAEDKPALIKVAVQPQTKAEVWQLMQTAGIFRESFKTPLLMIALGKLGRISRVMESPLTFASGVGHQAENQGQLSITKTKMLIDTLNED